MDYTKTLTLLSAVKNMKKASSFLRDRYFPTNENTDIFNSEAVILEYRDGSKKAAPFVVEQKNGVAVTKASTVSIRLKKERIWRSSLFQSFS